MQQWGFCRQQQKVQFIGDSIVPPDVGDLVLGLYPGLHFGFSHPHSQHMPPGNVLQTCKKRSACVTFCDSPLHPPGTWQFPSAYGRLLQILRPSRGIRGACAKQPPCQRRKGRWRTKIPGQSWPPCFSGQTCLQEGEPVSVFHPGVPPKRREKERSFHLRVEILLPAFHTSNSLSVAQIHHNDATATLRIRKYGLQNDLSVVDSSHPGEPLLTGNIPKLKPNTSSAPGKI